MLIFFCSDVTSSGPKGLLKSDVLKHIESKNLQPIEVKASAPEGAAAPAEIKRPERKPM